MKIEEAIDILDDSFITEKHFTEICNMLRDYEKYKIAIKYFQDNGKQETKDIIKNLLSY